MTDRPILFSAPMVRALLEGRKTQTRRVLSLPPAPSNLGHWEASTLGGDGVTDSKGNPVPEHPVVWHTRNGAIAAPIFRVGDRLWVKETWRTWKDCDRVKPTDLLDLGAPVFYEADGPNKEATGKTRVSIHMPRWASRITLTVTAVRVERLQDITEADCLAEGPRIKGYAEFRQDSKGRPSSLDGVMVHTDQDHVYATPRCWYRELWGHLNGGARAWNENPWVVVVTFTVEKRNIDA